MSARPPAVPAPAAASAVRGSRLRIAESRDEAIVGREFLLERPCLIGRTDECDISLKDPNISRRHAQVTAGPSGVTLTDLKSANGTWVGDQRVTEKRLAHMDRFRVGHTVFEVILESAEAEEEDLDLAQTSAIPLEEVLQSLQMKAVSKLEEEGEEVLVSANRPFFLDDPAAMWLVETGRIDVFTVAVRNGEAAGARSFFVGAEPGKAIFGMDLGRYGQGSAFLAVGKTGTRLRKIPLKRLAELAAQPVHAERIAMLVEGWIVSLTHALVRDIPPDAALPVDLVPGEPMGLDFQKRARARKGIVWVETEPGNLLLIGLSEVRVAGEAVPFPVTEEAWVESSEDGLVLTAMPTLEALPSPRFWAGVDAFHEALCEAEFVNKRLAAVDEFNRLKSKVAQAEHARESAYAEIGGILASPAERPVETGEAADLGPVFAACSLVCASLGMEAKKPSVDLNVERSFEETLQLVATASRFRTRVVALRGSWWEHDHGPILARYEATKQPVALLPTGPAAYEYVDTATGQRAPVDPAFAQTLHAFGHIFYRRFPDGALAVKQVVGFGARGLKRDLRSLIVMALGLGVLGSLTPYFTGRLFDTAIPQAQRGLLAQFCTALFLSAFTSAAFKLTQSIAVMRIQGRMDYAIQSALWDRLLDLPSTFFKTYSSGDLADRALGIDAIRQLVAGAGIGAILGSLSSLFYLVMMMGYSVPLALLGIALTLVFVSFTTSANLLQLRSQRDQLMVRGQISGLVLQLISGVGKLRVSGAENHGFRVWATSFAQQRRLAFRSGNIQNAVQVFNSGFPVISSICIFALLANVQKGGGGSLTTGDFIAFSAAYTLFLTAMQSLSDASLSLLKAVPIWERLVPILTAEPEVDESKAPPGPLKGEIEISHVSFRYAEDTPWILKDVSLKIRAGEFVAFVGGSGCGKSTLMRLMLGFEKPAKGSILYDGQDLSTLDVRLVRQQLGVVLQDSRVLPVDIFRNIVGSSSRTLDDAWQAAEAASLADDIREMPMGMHTYVSEGGGGLSGGQKQRLMIARAVVNRPKVLFLDEATSALDNKAQAIVTESMDKMHSTRIVIAHRLSTIVNADRICYLQDGVVAESGSYKELMEKDGLFAALAKRQIV
ncbi:MAG TPA: NHLP bacteriocin export ABC transporter permease/ATPase subunit [Thermoanaerobaculia bacterium]|nr:NHLP bacteriocin export ABC transporter permease/ATPase subunit [Thermoanaerobaculia bacterium]